MKSFLIQATTLLFLTLSLVACYNRSPEKLPMYKRKFRTQIASFEKQKESTDQRVSEGVSELTSIQEAINNARNVDKEFNKVYGNWQQVNKQVEDLEKEYNSLKQDAENLFTALESQTAGLNNQSTRSELSNALSTTKKDYLQNLEKTQKAIDQLKTLHAEAVDIIKALEVAVALKQIANINEQLKNIEDRVSTIMNDLNTTIVESKALYDQKIGAL